MDAVIARIKVFVLKYYPDILTDLGIDGAYLDLMIDDVVDRALIYTNREQLIDKYTEDLVEYDPSDEYWKNYQYYPIPPRLERVLARSVYESIRTIQKHATAENGDVASVKDNGQEITFRDRWASYFGSGGDAEIFSSSRSILDNFVLGTVVADADTSNLYGHYS